MTERVKGWLVHDGGPHRRHQRDRSRVARLTRRPRRGRAGVLAALAALALAGCGSDPYGGPPMIKGVPEPTVPSELAGVTGELTPAQSLVQRAFTACHELWENQVDVNAQLADDPDRSAVVAEARRQCPDLAERLDDA